MMTASTTFFIGGLPTFGNVTALDSLGIPLVDARVEAHRSGKRVYYAYTNENGTAPMGIYKGLYDIVVFWEEIHVKTESDYNAIADFNLTLTCDVFYPEFEVVDYSYEPLEGANVYMKHPNGTYKIVPFVTNETGMFTITQAPIGDFELIVKWRDVEVAVETHTVDKNGYIAQIVCAVFTLEITAVDSRGLGLAGSQIVIADSVSLLILDSRISDLDGFMKSQLPVGSFTISIFWRQRLVQQFDLDLVGDHNQNVTCWVYYVNLQAIDPHNVTVEGAQVVLTLPETGGVLDSQMTDLNGVVESRLPIGMVVVEVFWKEVPVHSSTYEVTEDIPSTDPIKLICDIYYLTLTALDDRDAALADAGIRVEMTGTGAVMDTQKTGAAGSVVFRVPVGDFDIYVDWLGVEVYYESTVMVNSDASMDLNCNVYYLTVTAKGDDGEKVSDVHITVESTEFDIIKSDYTDSGGVAEFRLPVGNYLVTGRLHKTHMLKEIDETVNATVDLQGSQEMTLKFTEYPPFIMTTPGFWIIILVILALVVIIILIVLIVKARSKSTSDEDLEEEKVQKPPPPDDEEEITPPPPEDEEDEEGGPDMPPPPDEEEMPEDVTEEDMAEEAAPEDDVSPPEEGEGPPDEEAPPEPESPVDDAPPVEEDPFAVGDEAPPDEPTKS
jgi:hypothetical protein